MDSPSPWPPPFPSSPFPPSPDVVEEDSSPDLWYVGAIINVVGSISINLGMNLMKLGHNMRGELDMPEEEKPPIRKFRSWVIGLVIFITGNILNFVSFAFAAQSLLAALGSLQLVCNVFFAYMVNKEPVTKLIIFSTGCIIGGCVLLVVFGNQSSETYTVDELIDFYKQPAYIVYLVMMGVVVFGTYVLYLHSKNVCRKRGQRGLWYFLMLVSYSIFSAMLGSQSVLFGKSISVILRTTFSGDNQLDNWYTWVVLPVFTITALFWVTRLNKGLRMFPAMVIVPLMQISWTLFSIVSGMIYFEEYKGFTTLMWIMFPVGVVIVFSGVFLLTVGGGRGRPPDELEEEEKLPDSTPGSLSKMTVHENAMFTARPDGEAGPSELGPPTSAKMSLGQTLRFTSTWAPASVAVSPGSNMNRTLMTNESLRRQRRATEALSDLNATSRTNRTDDPHTFDKNSTLNRTAQSNTSRVSETPSMMGTMKKGIKSMHNRLTSDLGIETKTGFKLAMGLGDGALSGVSLFAMPALDFTSTKV
ncbi:hypothetical protein HXX76_014538 [Chlamydomonas incerta]|uniref:Probable magnesium transporter n=1 Tax=Chlamydomonas incerta TaxID=51695 RepID=A0A835SFB1_CHLIN|nr:hypothetical protein HXX76_014538 [Chlamydomonas incerta]|eukprot:KAG2424486.1 hypothetical protein HXX76_014538 [Chlamydomonas incerta]